MVAVPAPTIWINPFTIVATFTSELLYVTGKPEEAIAAASKSASPVFFSARVLKVMDCSYFTTTKSCETEAAAL